MKTAKEYWLSKFPDAEKDWQQTGHDDNFQVRMMEEYAKYYHEQQVKSVDLADVVGRSEKLPQPDCHFYDDENQRWIWAYSTELIDSLR